MLASLFTYLGTNSCSFCKQNWVHVGTLASWYFAYLAFVQAGACNAICGGSCMNGSVVKEAHMPQCLQAYFTSAGAAFANTLVIIDTNGSQVNQIKHSLSFFSLVNPKETKDKYRMMQDVRRIAKEVGPGGSFLLSVRNPLQLDLILWN